MSKKIFIPILSLVIVAALILVYLLVLRPGETDRPVRIAYQPMATDLPAYLAKEKGMFADRNVQVELIEMSSGNDMFNALLAGQVDILPSMSAVPVLHLELQNPGAVRVFGIGYMREGNAIDSIVVRQDAPIESLADLAGKKVGLFPGTTATNLLRALLQREGIDASGVTLVSLPPPAQVGSLVSGAIDALFSYEPITTIALAKGGFRTVYGSVYVALIDPCAMGVGVISRRFEKEHPGLAKRAKEALLAASQFVSDQPGEARKILTEFAKIPPPIANQVNLIVVEAVDDDNTQDLQKFVELLKEIGELPKVFDVKGLVSPGR